MPDIVIRCPECGLSKTVPSNRIPDKPVKVNCKRCANRFVFTKTRKPERSAAEPDILSPPDKQPNNRPEPAPSPLATRSVAVHGDSSDTEIPRTPKPPKKKLQAFIVGLLLLIIALVPLRIWLINQASSTPYPNWMATSTHGLAVLFGDHFHVLDFEGNVKWSRELPGDTDPCQISWNGIDVWVSDWKNDRILQFHDNGLREVPLIDSNIQSHMNVAVNPLDAFLYVADSQSSKIKIFDDKGEYVDEFGKKGYSDGSLLFPKDITFNEQGQLIIGNTLRSSVDVFLTNGTYVETLIKHEANPLEKIKDISPEAFKDVSADKFKGLFDQHFIYDFAIDNQNLVTIECNRMVTECEIVSYDLDGRVLASAEHQPATETQGDIAIWQERLFVSNCVKRTIDVYGASTLSYQGTFSHQIDQLGIGYQKQAKLYLVSSKVLLYFMILSLIPIIWLYIHSKR